MAHFFDFAVLLIEIYLGGVSQGCIHFADQVFGFEP